MNHLRDYAWVYLAITMIILVALWKFYVFGVGIYEFIAFIGLIAILWLVDDQFGGFRCPKCQKWFAGRNTRRSIYDGGTNYWKCKSCQHEWETTNPETSD